MKLSGHEDLRVQKTIQSIRTAFQNLSPGEQELFTTFIHATGLSMYRQWVEGGKKLPVEEVIDITNKLLSQGVAGLLPSANPESGQ